MRDARGNVIYVGKAMRLRNRVRSYFQSTRHGDAKTRELVATSPTSRSSAPTPPTEALILENELIKRYQPKYNVMLKDSKTYPYLKITNEEWPRIISTRRIVDDGGRYFGPYTSAGLGLPDPQPAQPPLPLPQVRQADHRQRGGLPLLPHAPVHRALHRRGRPRDLHAGRRGRGAVPQRPGGRDPRSARRGDGAGRRRLELRARRRAARPHQRRSSTSSSGRRSSARTGRTPTSSRSRRARAATPASRSASCATASLGSEFFPMQARVEDAPGEILAGFVSQFYADAAVVPPTAHPRARPARRRAASCSPMAARSAAGGAVDDRGAEARAASATRRDGRQERRGEPGAEPPEIPLRREEDDRGDDRAGRRARPAAPAAPDRVLRHLEPAWHQPGRQHGRLRGRPAGQEGVPPLHDQDRRRQQRLRHDARGHLAAGSAAPPRPTRSGRQMGGPPGSGHRRRRQGPAQRRPRGLARGRLDRAADRRPGQGERGALPPGQPAPIILPRDSQALFLVQRVRDEAHRFAVSFHRQKRSKTTFQSRLDEIPGVGPKRKQALLRHSARSRASRKRRPKNCSPCRASAAPSPSRSRQRCELAAQRRSR